jgi:hypothetical protein
MNMSKRPQKFPKTLLRRAHDCEAHIKFLSETLDKSLEDDPVYYKQVAAELRVLVADKAPKNRILIKLMSDLQVSISINLPIHPPHKWEIIGKDKQIEDYNKPIPIKLFCEKGLVCILKGEPYSNNELIRLIAQQEGSSHESSHIDKALAMSHSIHFGGVPSHVYALRVIGKNIRSAGVSFMKYIISNRQYPARYDWK